MSTTLAPGSTFGVLAKQEIRNYLKHKLFWFSAVLTAVMIVLSLLGRTATEGESSTAYMIAPAALIGLLGLVTMFGLTRRSDRAAQAAGAVSVPERTRTLALATAAVVPLSLGLAQYVVAVVEYYAYPPTEWIVPPQVSDAFLLTAMFGTGVMSTVGGPLLGLVLARYLPLRGVSAIAAVVIVVVTILLQGNFEGGQPYRVFWVWTYFVGQVSQGWSADPSFEWHTATAPGNPYLWVTYLAVLCVLGVVTALLHDPESDRANLKRLALGLLAAAVVLGVLTMMVGYSEPVFHPLTCESC